jgi:acyl-coenzyme A thioesterase PaaI-like protein
MALTCSFCIATVGCTADARKGVSMSPLNNPRILKWIMNVWPPFLGAGIRVRHIAADWRSAEVTLTLRWYNRNYVNTHFGGSLFSMVDPFCMLLLINLLGRGYRVWDKAAAVEFLLPGKGTVTARFFIDEALLARIREKTARGQKHYEAVPVDVTDEHGRVVARIVKTLYIRKYVLRKA